MNVEIECPLCGETIGEEHWVLMGDAEVVHRDCYKCLCSVHIAKGYEALVRRIEALEDRVKHLEHRDALEHGRFA